MSKYVIPSKRVDYTSSPIMPPRTGPRVMTTMSGTSNRYQPPSVRNNSLVDAKPDFSKEPILAPTKPVQLVGCWSQKLSTSNKIDQPSQKLVVIKPMPRVYLADTKDEAEVWTDEMLEEWAKMDERKYLEEEEQTLQWSDEEQSKRDHINYWNDREIDIWSVYPYHIDMYERFRNELFASYFRMDRFDYVFREEHTLNVNVDDFFERVEQYMHDFSL